VKAGGDALRGLLLSCHATVNTPPDALVVKLSVIESDLTDVEEIKGDSSSASDEVGVTLAGIGLGNVVDTRAEELVDICDTEVIEECLEVDGLLVGGDVLADSDVVVGDEILDNMEGGMTVAECLALASGN